MIDLERGTTSRMASHGDGVISVAINAGGDVIAIGTADGVVRIGRVNGEEPHLLLGHRGPVESIDISPDGQWVATSADGEIRLWPMPDVAKPPLHTLPLEELVARLDAMTNVRVVKDEQSAAAYRLDIAPFPGWRDVPAW